MPIAFAAYRNAIVPFSRVRLRHVGRAQNLAGMRSNACGPSTPQPLAPAIQSGMSER
jgi:ribonuclease HI